MKESEYTLIANLTNVRIMRHLIMKIIPIDGIFSQRDIVEINTMMTDFERKLDLLIATDNIIEHGTSQDMTSQEIPKVELDVSQEYKPEFGGEETTNE